jgi:tetratricopeptide (TPR) repeat protein
LDEQKEAASVATVFYSYAHEDEPFLKKLEKHLSSLRRDGLISEWHDRRISAGTEWATTIDTYLNTADIILLLVSPDFMASEYCYGIELEQAMKRYQSGEASVIPIILRPADWENALFGKLQPLPKDGKPVTDRTWGRQDEAFLDVVKGIRKVVEELATNPRVVVQPKEQTITSVGSQKTKEQWIDEGHNLFNLQRYEEAITAYNQALHLDPNLPRAYYNKGFALVLLQRYEEAIPVLDQAIRLNPNDALVYNNKGFALYNLKRNEEAVLLFDQAIRLNRYLDFVYNNKGCALLDLQRYEEAISVFDQAISLNPRGRVYNNKGFALEQLGRSKQAKQAYRRAQQLSERW